MDNEKYWKFVFEFKCRTEGSFFIEFLLDVSVDANALNKYGKTMLSYAAECGNMGIVEFLVQKGADGNVTNSDGSKPLHMAAKYGHPEIVKFFLSLGIFVDSRDNKDYTPLHYVADQCKLLGSYQEVVHFLLNSKADLNAVNEEGFSPLHLAGKHAHEDLAELFIRLGANVHCCDEDQSTVMHYCCRHGWGGIVRSLIQEFNIDLNVRNIAGHIPLSLANDNGHGHIMKLLIDSGAEVEAPYYQDQILLHYVSSCGMLDRVQDLVRMGCDLNPKSSQGKTPLHMALQNSHISVAEYLIDSGADVNCCDNSGITALHIACQEDLLGAVKYLVKKGCDLNAKSSFGGTPLVFAARESRFGVVEYLMDSGADVNCCDGIKMTALHYFCQKGSLDAVKSIVSKGCELDAKSSDGDTPLLLAAKNSHFNVVEYLIESGADINCSDKDKKTPLHLACKTGSLVVVKALTKKGCHLNVLEGCRHRNTPLHIAVEMNNLEIVIHLLEVGADCNVQNRFWTPFVDFLCSPIICLEGIILFLEKGAYFENYYENTLIVEGVYQDINLCTLALMNKFNVDLLKMYGIPAISKLHLPPVERLKIVNGTNAAQDIAQSVRNEIQTNGHCNVMKVRPINLSILSVESLVKNYYT